MRGSRNYRQGGPGQSGLTKKAFFLFFFSPQLILQKSNGQFQRNLSFFKVPEGVQHFPGGRGSNCLFPIETHITCDFPWGGGGRTPCPPSGSALGFLEKSLKIKSSLKITKSLKSLEKSSISTIFHRTYLALFIET